MPRSDDTMMWAMLHDRVCGGDAQAFDELATTYLPYISNRLSRRLRNLDEHLIAECVEDALLEYGERPRRFDATRGVPMENWLTLLARGHLANRLRRIRRVRQREHPVGVHEQELESPMSRIGRGRNYLILEREDEIIENQMALLQARFSAHEITGLQLLANRSELGEWVKLLHLEDLSRCQQCERVEKEKERLRKKRYRLTRAINGEDTSGAPVALLVETEGDRSDWG